MLPAKLKKDFFGQTLARFAVVLQQVNCQAIRNASYSLAANPDNESA